MYERVFNRFTAPIRAEKESPMEKITEKHPEVFTGETVTVSDPSPEQQAAIRGAMEDVKRLSAPLVEWIRENYGYNAEIHISADFVCVKHCSMSLPFPITEI